MEPDTLYTKLKKLFSSEIVVRNVGGKKLKIADTSQVSFASDRNSLRDRFNRLRSSGQGIQTRDMAMSYQQSRIELYRDYDTIDLDPILSSALNIVSDECLTENELGYVLTVRSSNEQIKGILENLFYDILNIEFNLWSWTRSLIKYGDFYLILNISPEYGIYGVTPASAYEMTRVEEMDQQNGRLMVRFHHDGVSGGLKYEFFEVAHFRMLGDSNMLPYGKSYLEGARRVWKQLCLHHETRIWTTEGYKKICDVHPGDVVYSFDPKTQKTLKTRVKVCRKTGARKTVLVKTKHRQLQLTPDHPVLVKNKHGEFQYKSVDAISIDSKSPGESDMLVLPSVDDPETHAGVLKMNMGRYRVKLNMAGMVHCKKRSPKGIIESIRQLDLNYPYKMVHSFLKGKKSIPYDIFLKIQAQFDLTLEMVVCHLYKSEFPAIVNSALEFELTAEFIEFFGFMLGDGWLGGKNKATVGYAYSTHTHINDKYDAICSKYCSRFTVSKVKTNPDAPGQINYYSAELKEIFVALGFKSGFLRKEIPAWIFSLGVDNKRRFIRGLFDADGSWKWGVIGLSNKKMITQLEILCQQAGIMCNAVKCCREKVETDVSGVTRQPTYKLYINFNQLYDTALERILSVTSTEHETDVWDLEVDSEHHNFVAEGLVVHNCLMEDAMMINRIMRAPERRIFKIDIGNIPPSEVDGYIQKIINGMKKVPYLDERTGDYNLRYNLHSMMDDLFIPVRGGDSGTQIDTLPGMEWTGMDDIEYLRNKMLAALSIPKAYLSYEEDLSGKSTLSAEDVRFAKTIQRIQKIVVSELSKMALIHLYVQGFQDASLLDFSLELTNPSTIFEAEKINIWKEKVNLAKDMIDTQMFSKKFIYETIFKLSDDDVKQLESDVISDTKGVWRVKQISEEGNDPYTSGQAFNKEGGSADVPGLGDSFGGDIGGDMGGGDLPELPGEGGVGDEMTGETPDALKESTGNGFEHDAQALIDDVDEVLGERAERDQKRRRNRRLHPDQEMRGEDPLGKDRGLEHRVGHTEDARVSHPIKDQPRKPPMTLVELDAIRNGLNTKYPPKKMLNS